MDFVIGIVLSALFSVIKPFVRGRFGLRDREAMIVLVLVISLLIALIKWYFGATFWQNAAVIFASTQGFYNLLWGLVGEDKISKFIDDRR